MADAVRTTEPHDRLTRICDRLSDAFDADPEKGVAKMMIFLDDPETERSALVMHGYDKDVEGVAHLIMHLKAIFEANGKTLVLAPLNRG